MRQPQSSMAVNTSAALLLSAAVIAPLFGLVEQYQTRIDTATARLERSATLIAEGVRNAVAVGDATLEDVANRIDPSDLIAFPPGTPTPVTGTTLRLDAKQSQPGTVPFAMYDDTCRLRYGVALLPPDVPTLDACLQLLHTTPVTSTLETGPPAILRTRTVFHPDGTIAGFAALTIDITTFTATLSRSNPPNGSVALLLDETFTVVASAPTIAGTTERTLQHRELVDMARTPGGFVTSRINARLDDDPLTPESILHNHLVTVHRLPDLPFIVMTGEAPHTYLAGFTMRALSITLYVLLLSVFVILATREYHRTRRRRDELEDLAHVDALTQVANRRAFEAALTAALARSRRTHAPLSLVMIDLDRFKRVNDQHGHHTGDAILAAVSTAMAKAVREGDVLARLGGDEFAAMLPDTDEAGAWQVIERIEEDVSALRVSTLSGALLTPRMSIGVTTTQPDASTSMAELMQRADEAMYATKRKRRHADRSRRASRSKPAHSRPVAE